MSYYKHHVFFCANQRENGAACCGDKNAQTFRDYAKDRIKEMKLSGPGKCRINSAGCMDRCGKGPVIAIYPEGVWYRYADKADIDEIIEEHLLHGRIVDRLKI